MVKNTIFSFLTIICTTHLFSNEIVQLIRVSPPTVENIREIQTLGIPVDHAFLRPEVYIEFTASPEDVQILREHGFSIEVIHHDLESFYSARLTQNITREFGYGSMGGYYTFDEVIAFLDDLHALYPEIVGEKQIIGYSLQDRPIYAVRMSDNPEIDEDEPEMLYTGLHHAREPLSMMALLYFMDQLAQGYEEITEYTAILNHRQLWFVPVVNPDGYEYNREIAPNGGGMVRKNRRPGCANIQWAGVDLNRNYGFGWGYDDSGSSPDPCNQVYRGPAEFSEPETQVISEFEQQHDFKMVLNYHSYGNYLIYPSGAIPGDLPPEDDLVIFREFGSDMAQFNGYLVGSDMETVNYSVNGDSDSWLYNVLGTFAMTPEIGNNDDGFWPPADRLFPLVEENLYPNIFTAWAVGSRFRSEAEFSSEIFLPGLTYTITPHIFNQGLGESQGEVMVEISAAGNVEFDGYLQNAGIMSARTDIIMDGVDFTVSPDALSGQVVELSVQVWDGTNYSFRDTIEIMLGQPVVIFYDDAENGMSNWNTSTWGLSTDSFSGTYAFADSPAGDYPALSSSFMNLALPLDLSEASGAYMTFQAKWDIETDYDFAQVLASLNGTSWTPLAGSNMTPGSGNGMQPQGQFGYDGNSDWVAETLSLNEFAGQPYIWLKFRLSSDTHVEGDGFYFDDFTIWSFLTQSLTGDVNVDGNVDVLDIVMVVNFILNLSDPTPQQLAAADLNGDSELNVLDVVILVNIILNG